MFAGPGLPGVDREWGVGGEGGAGGREGGGGGGGRRDGRGEGSAVYWTLRVNASYPVGMSTL